MEYENHQNEKFILTSPQSHLDDKQHPWRRLFARTVDIMFIGVLLFLLIIFLLSLIFPQQISILVKYLENPILASVSLYLFWIPVESLFISFFGTTPAKWVFGIYISNESGEKLTYTNAFKRTFHLFIQGEGLGIPLVNIFTRIAAYRRLNKTGTTLWDTETTSVVTYKKYGIFRITASIFIVFLTMILISIFNKF